MPVLALLGPAVLAGLAPKVFAAGDPEYGAYLAAPCATCHQTGGASAGGVPSITGWPEASFVAAMAAYRAKARDNAVMRTLAAALSDAEIAALAAYFAGLPASGGK